MKSKIGSPKSGWVLLSQIIFVPIYVIIFALSKVLAERRWTMSDFSLVKCSHF